MNKKVYVEDRLNKYWNLFESNDFINTNDENICGLTIHSLSMRLDIPIDVVRNDIFYIVKVSLCTALLPDFDAYSQDHNSISITKLEKLWARKDNTNLEAAFLNGHFDFIPFMLATPEYKYFIPFTTDELQALRHYSSTQLNISSKTFLFKNSPHFMKYEKNFFTNLNIVNEAITTKKQVSFHTLCPSEKAPQKHVIFPVRITYDSTENSYAILSIEDSKISVFNFEYITHTIQTLNRELSLTESHHTQINHILDIAPQVWGNEFESKPVRVCVRFENSANMWEKVKKELSCRTKGKLYEKKDYLYFEDDVYGISSFKKWVASYGSSAIVCEPAFLRDEIIASLMARIV